MSGAQQQDATPPVADDTRVPTDTESKLWDYWLRYGPGWASTVGATGWDNNQTVWDDGTTSWPL